MLRRFEDLPSFFHRERHNFFLDYLGLLGGLAICDVISLDGVDRYTVGSDVSSDEELYDTHGNRIDAGYIERAVTEVHRSLSGRPSLSGQRARSPQIAFRLPAEEREQAQRLAEADGVSLSEFARQALEERLRRAS